MMTQLPEKSRFSYLWELQGGGIEEIINQGYSLNPGRYVGVSEKEEVGFDLSKKK
ncbi:MAG: hypothetical protein WAV32_09485 [Halobacteriota archaeon]